MHRQAIHCTSDFAGMPVPRWGGGGEGVTSIIKYKMYIQTCGWNGVYFSGPKYMNGYHFHFKSISMGYLFTQKVYEWAKFEKKSAYEWVQFSIW